MKKYSFLEHLLEFKSRLLRLFLIYIVFFLVSYYLSDIIFSFLANPLEVILAQKEGKIIYTGITELFFSYLKISFYTAFFLVLPICTYQIYAFVSPGLHSHEKISVKLSLSFVPVLFFLGMCFAYFFVMPNAWNFFIGFGGALSNTKIDFYAKVSEYVDLSLQFFLAFGLAFELPVAIMVLASLNLVDVKKLKAGRRVATVLIFIASAILTPPDVLSQFCLAIPLLLLYEISIIACNLIEKR